MLDQDNGFSEAGAKSVSTKSILDTINLDDLRLVENKNYLKIVTECKLLHNDLLKNENTEAYIENPALIGNYLGKLRLNANKFFQYSNIYIDILSDLQREYAVRRQGIYTEQLMSGKSPSAAEKHGREMTREDESKVSIIENTIQQIKNEYERYNGICMYLQSRMKEFNTERMLN